MRVNEALKVLKEKHPNKYKLLDLKLLKEMSWKEVRECLTEEEGRDIKDEALRKRLSQTKKLLRRIFHELYEPL